MEYTIGSTVIAMFIFLSPFLLAGAIAFLIKVSRIHRKKLEELEYRIEGLQTDIGTHKHE
jgi:hypothetical protein